MDQQNTILDLRNVVKRFGGITASNNISIHVPQGSIYGVVGPNGAGKTTLFNMITGVYDTTEGEIVFDGEKINGLPTHIIAQKGIARTFQNIRLFGSMTVFENVLLARHLRRESNVLTATLRMNAREESAMRADTEALLRVVGLEDVRDEPSTALPYGKQRLLEIARALATNPTLLLLDEPAAGMNPQETEALAAFIRDIKERFHLTIFIIEHHMNLIMDISDRIYVVDFGRLIAQGTPAEIQNNDAVIAAYLGGDEP